MSLDSVVYGFQSGASPEEIQRSFPALTLEQVYGSVTFYLAHKVEIDEYLADDEAEFEKLRQASRSVNPELYEKLERARKEMLIPQS